MAAPRSNPRSFGSELSRWRSICGVTRRRGAGALRRVGEQLGINPETLRNWVSQAEIDQGQRPMTTKTEAQRIARSSSVRTRSCGGRMRSCGRRRRFSPRRSSTAS